MFPSVLSNTVRFCFLVSGVSLLSILQTNALPNLRPYVDPDVGNALVFFHQTGGTDESGSLRVSRDVFMNWSIENASDQAITNRFFTTLYVDGDRRLEWRTDGIPGRHWTGVKDFNLGVLSPGIHNIWIEIDSGNAVSESDELDNVGFRFPLVTASTNLPPITLRVPDVELSPGFGIPWRIWAYDPNTNDILSFRSLSAMPAGMSLDPNTGIMSWTPPARSPAQVHEITVEVEDNGSPSLSATNVVRVIVSADRDVSEFGILTNRPFALLDENLSYPFYGDLKLFPAALVLRPGPSRDLSEEEAMTRLEHYFSAEMSEPYRLATELDGDGLALSWEPSDGRLQQSPDMEQWEFVDASTNRFMVAVEETKKFFRVVHPAVEIFQHPVAREKIPSPNLRLALAGLVGTIGEPAIDYLLFARTPEGRPQVAEIVFSGIGSGAHVEGYGEFGQTRVVFREWGRADDPFLLSSIMAHEALHHDSPDGHSEEVFNAFLHTLIYINQLQRHPELALGATRNVQLLNTTAIALLNSGHGLNASALESEGPILPGAGTPLQNFWELIVSSYKEVPNSPTSGNDVLKSIMVNTVPTGECSGERFDQSLLECVGEHWTLTPSEWIRAARILRLDVFHSIQR